MARTTWLTALLAAAVAIAGCGSGTTTTKGEGESLGAPPPASSQGDPPAEGANSQEPTAAGQGEDRAVSAAAAPSNPGERQPEPVAGDIAGRWYGRLSPTGPSASPEQARQLQLLAEAMMVDIELGKDGKFKFNAPGMPLTGTYTRKADRITLQVETVMGRPMKQAASEFGAAVEQFKDPLEGEVRQGGKTLFFAGKKDRPGEMDMTFTRTPPADDRVGKRTVTSIEAKYLGDYGFDESYDPPGEDTPAQQMMRSFASNVSLALREDNTFVMNMMLRMTGTWKVEQDLLVLTVKSPKAMIEQIPPGEKPEIKARPEQGGKRLLMLNDKTNAVDFALKRT